MEQYSVWYQNVYLALAEVGVFSIYIALFAKYLKVFAKSSAFRLPRLGYSVKGMRKTFFQVWSDREGGELLWSNLLPQRKKQSVVNLIVSARWSYMAKWLIITSTWIIAENMKYRLKNYQTGK